MKENKNAVSKDAISSKHLSSVATNQSGLFATGKIGMNLRANGAGIKATVVNAEQTQAGLYIGVEGTINKPAKPCVIL